MYECASTINSAYPMCEKKQEVCCIRFCVVDQFTALLGELQFQMDHSVSLNVGKEEREVVEEVWVHSEVEVGCGPDVFDASI